MKRILAPALLACVLLFSPAGAQAQKFIFTPQWTAKSTTLQDAVIIELKQDGRVASPMRAILLDRRVKPVRISKYCIREPARSTQGI